MPSDTRYCICRTKSGHGFMICCDNCSEWFHGRCINISKKASEQIDAYYCDACRGKNPTLAIKYIQNAPERKVGLKQENHDDQRTEKKVLEKRQPVTSQTKLKPKTNNRIQHKPEPTKRGQRAKYKGQNKKQCANPDCIFEIRHNSKYCSDECGLEFNKKRYELFFIPKWKTLEENKHSKARLEKLKELDRLEKEKSEVEDLIRDLKIENDELKDNIRRIKEDAGRLREANVALKKTDEKDANSDSDDSEEFISGDPAKKSFCITCGATIPSENALKHWSSCHRKNEAIYNFTANKEVTFAGMCDGDKDPQLYCLHHEKKANRFCMHIKSACPQHSNWQSDKDEVCGCPLNIMQKLVPDGNYCLELKKDCTQHYHWDRFRLAQLNIQRVDAFSRLATLGDKLYYTNEQLRDTYGGVVGVMLHNTLDHREKEDRREIDVEMELLE